MKKAINQESMRASNKRAILELIQKNTAISKSEIAANLGLSPTSVSTFINELTTQKKIINCGTAKSTGGRKSALYQINPQAFYVIGLDMQVDRIITVLTNSIGNVIATSEVFFQNKDEWRVIPILKENIQRIARENNISSEMIGGIGIGVPGIVQSKSGTVEFAPNLGWQNVNLRQLLNINKLIMIENEANAAALGEKAFGVAGAVTNFIYISIGIGVGCGLVINGKLFMGRYYHAGEFGHMTVEPSGLTCRCGNQGCWEVYTSNEAAIKLYNQISQSKIHNYEEFLDLVFQENRYAMEVLESNIRYLGIGIANLVNGLNPDMVIIGGKIVEAGDLIYPKLLRQIKERSLNKTFSGFTLEFSHLKNQTTAMGMASLIIDQLMTAENI